MNLADGFKEEHALHVAYGATDLNEAHIGLLATAATVHRDGSHALNPVLCVGVVSRSTLCQSGTLECVVTGYRTCTALVTWGMTCTVLPKYLPLRSSASTLLYT